MFFSVLSCIGLNHQVHPRIGLRSMASRCQRGLHNSPAYSGINTTCIWILFQDFYVSLVVCLVFFCRYSLAFSCTFFPVHDFSRAIFVRCCVVIIRWLYFRTFPGAFFQCVLAFFAIHFVLSPSFLFLFSRFSPFSMYFCRACFHGFPRDLPNNPGQASKTFSILAGAFSCLFWDHY